MAQRLRRGGADGVEWVVIEHLGEHFSRFARRLLAERLDRHPPADHVVCHGKLGFEQFHRLVEGDVGEQSVFGVEPHHLGLFRERDVEVLRGVVDQRLVIHRPTWQMEPQRGWQVEQHHLVARLLGLVDMHVGELLLWQPLVGDLQPRRAAVVDPLVEEPVEFDARGVLKLRPQVRRDDAGELVLLQIAAHRPAVDVLAQLAAEHVQHPASLGIGAEVELLPSALVPTVDDRAGVVLFAEHAVLGVFVQAVEHLIAAQSVAHVQVRVVRGEALIQPQVAPIFAGDKIAKPLVGRFVSVERPAAVHGFGLVREDRAVRQRREARVLHPTRGEVADGHLVVLVPREGQADLLLEERDDLVGVGKRVGGVLR